MVECCILRLGIGFASFALGLPHEVKVAVLSLLQQFLACAELERALAGDGAQ